MITDLLTIVLISVGALFFTLGTIGLLRFPDVHARLHALTKADNLGLGFVAAGLAIDAASPMAAAKLLVIWLLVLLAATTACYLVARQGIAMREVHSSD